MSDRLDRALRALRENETGSNPKSEATLDRILASRRRVTVTWGKRVRMWLPIAAVLVMATTALARSGALGTVRALLGGRSEATTERRADAVVPVAPALSAATPEPSLQVEASSANPAPPDTAPAPTLAPAPARMATPAALALAPARTPAPPRAPAVVPSAPASSTASAPQPRQPAPEPSSLAGPSEADVYARAHRLHFNGADPRAALTAWDDYLVRYPSGRFAPDARYNRAIDLLKMKRYPEARAALQPFAEGSFGGYHREDARELLRSIP